MCCYESVGVMSLTVPTCDPSCPAACSCRADCWRLPAFSPHPLWAPSWRRPCRLLGGRRPCRLDCCRQICRGYCRRISRRPCRRPGCCRRICRRLCRRPCRPCRRACCARQTCQRTWPADNRPCWRRWRRRSAWTGASLRRNHTWRPSAAALAPGYDLLGRHNFDQSSGRRVRASSSTHTRCVSQRTHPAEPMGPCVPASRAPHAHAPVPAATSCGRMASIPRPLRSSSRKA